jgi:predicted alpha/beta-hydrolase family hydrolase
MTAQPVEISSTTDTHVSGLLLRPDNARLLYVLGHGAGAGMRHPFLETMSGRFADRRIATLRYQFPYMEAGRKRPDSPKVLESVVRSAIEAAAAIAPDLPLIAGGKSMGGRISSHVAANDPPGNVLGLVFLGYPLHPPKQPDSKRAEHLYDIDLPMLFLQGTRDDLADLDLLRPIVDALGSRTTMHVVDGADHSFKMLKRSGREQDEVLDEIADAVGRWAGLIVK